MNTTLHRETAKIYEFPIGGRAAFNTARRLSQASVEALASARSAKVVYGGNWYHEEALEDVDPARQR